jgi:hypothetical protein
MVASWSVDRLGRSLTDLLSILQGLHDKGVGLFLHQQGLDTSTTAGKLTISRFELVYAFAFSPAATKSIELSRILPRFRLADCGNWCDAAIHEGKAGRARPHGKKTSFAFTAFIMASSPGRLSLPLAPLMPAS